LEIIVEIHREFNIETHLALAEFEKSLWQIHQKKTVRNCSQ
jgi:hypothetical protein